MSNFPRRGGVCLCGKFSGKNWFVLTTKPNQLLMKMGNGGDNIFKEVTNGVSIINCSFLQCPLCLLLNHYLQSHKPFISVSGKISSDLLIDFANNICMAWNKVMFGKWKNLSLKTSFSCHENIEDKWSWCMSHRFLIKLSVRC